jgi:hypothetical protein
MASLNRKKLRKVTRKKLTPKIIPPTENQNDTLQFLNANAKGTFNTITTDESGYGASPAAERNNTYFSYFNDVAPTDPEILEKTAVYIKYLIDKNGELTDPKPGDAALYNLKSTFEKDTKLFISPEQASQAFSPLIGSHSIENVGTVQLVLTTETGRGVPQYETNIYCLPRPGIDQAQSVGDYNINLSARPMGPISPSNPTASWDASDDYYGHGYYTGSITYPSSSIGWNGGDWMSPTTASAFVQEPGPGGPFDTTYTRFGPTAFNRSGSAGTSASYNNFIVDNLNAKITYTSNPKDFALNLANYARMGFEFERKSSDIHFSIDMRIQRSIDNGSTWTNLNVEGTTPNGSNWYANGRTGGNASTAKNGILYLDENDTIDSTPFVVTRGSVRFQGTIPAGDGWIGLDDIAGGGADNWDALGIATTPIGMESGDQVRFQIRVKTYTNNTFATENKPNLNNLNIRTLMANPYGAFISEFKTNQNYQNAFRIIREGTPARFFTLENSGSYQENKMAIVSPTSDLRNAFASNPQALYQVFYGDQYNKFINQGFSLPIFPVTPKVGDYIRFEYNPDYQYRIMKIDNNFNDIYLWPPIGGQDIVLDHFTISRVVDDGNYIIIDKFYPASGSVVGELTGFARPENLTQEIQDNFGNLTTQLVKDGVLNQ